MEKDFTVYSRHRTRRAAIGASRKLIALGEQGGRDYRIEAGDYGKGCKFALMRRNNLGPVGLKKMLRLW